MAASCKLTYCSTERWTSTGEEKWFVYISFLYLPLKLLLMKLTVLVLISILLTVNCAIKFISVISNVTNGAAIAVFQLCETATKPQCKHRCILVNINKGFECLSVGPITNSNFQWRTPVTSSTVIHIFWCCIFYLRCENFEVNDS